MYQTRVRDRTTETMQDGLQEGDKRTGADGDEGPTILVADDEASLVRMYAAMLEDVYTVRTATSVEEALTEFTDEIDVVLSDRRTPDRGEDELLGALRSRGFDGLVATTTTVEPDQDIRDLPFDAYVVKPVDQSDLRRLVEDLLLRSQYSEGVQELLRITSRLVAIESERPQAGFDSDDEYRRLRTRRERLERINRERHSRLIERVDPRIVYEDVLETTQTGDSRCY